MSTKTIAEPQILPGPSDDGRRLKIRRWVAVAVLGLAAVSGLALAVGANSTLTSPGPVPARSEPAIAPRPPHAPDVAAGCLADIECYGESQSIPNTSALQQPAVEDVLARCMQGGVDCPPWQSRRPPSPMRTDRATPRRTEYPGPRATRGAGRRRTAPRHRSSPTGGCASSRPTRAPPTSAPRLRSRSSRQGLPKPHSRVRFAFETARSRSCTPRHMKGALNRLRSPVPAQRPVRLTLTAPRRESKRRGGAIPSVAWGVTEEDWAPGALGRVCRPTRPPCLPPAVEPVDIQHGQ